MKNLTVLEAITDHFWHWSCLALQFYLMKLLSLLTGQRVWSDAEQMAHDKHSERARLCLSVSQPWCLEQWGCEEHNPGTFHFLAGKKFNGAVQVTWCPSRCGSKRRTSNKMALLQFFQWTCRKDTVVHGAVVYGCRCSSWIWIWIHKLSFTCAFKCYHIASNMWNFRGIFSAYQSYWELYVLFVA